jgi:hypothetical protein
MENEKKVTGYMTKYALVSGIEKVRAVLYGDYVYTGNSITAGNSIQLKPGKDFFESRDAAEAAAKEMATRKIVSIKKQLAKLEKLVATPKWSKSTEE